MLNYTEAREVSALDVETYLEEILHSDGCCIQFSNEDMQETVTYNKSPSTTWTSRARRTRNTTGTGQTRSTSNTRKTLFNTEKTYCKLIIFSDALTEMLCVFFFFLKQISMHMAILTAAPLAPGRPLAPGLPY